MARYSSAWTTITSTAVADTTSFTAGQAPGFLRANTTLQLKVNEVYVGGEDTASTPTTMIVARTSTISVGALSVGTTSLMDALSTAPGTTPNWGSTAATTFPQRSATAYLLSLSLNTYGGIARWQARYGEEITVYGATQPLGGNLRFLEDRRGQDLRPCDLRSGVMPWVQTASNSAAAATVNVTINGVVAGNAIVVFMMESGVGAITVSDAQGSYSNVTSLNDTQQGLTEAIYILLNANAGTHTIAISGVGATLIGGLASEYSGVVSSHGGSSNPQGSPGTGVGAVTSGLIASPVIGDTIVGFSIAGTNTFTAASGTVRSNIFLSGIQWTIQEDQVYGGANAAATFTDSAGTQRFGTHAIALNPGLAILGQAVL